MPSNLLYKSDQDIQRGGFDTLYWNYFNLKPLTNFQQRTFHSNQRNPLVISTIKTLFSTFLPNKNFHPILLQENELLCSGISQVTNHLILKHKASEVLSSLWTVRTQAPWIVLWDVLNIVTISESAEQIHSCILYKLKRQDFTSNCWLKYETKI